MKQASKPLTRRSFNSPLVGWTMFPFLLILSNGNGVLAWSLVGAVGLAPLMVFLLHARTSKGLRTGRAKAAPFHAGRPGRVQVEVFNDNPHDVLDVSVHCLGSERGYEGPSREVPLRARQSTWVTIPVPAGLLRRGEHPAAMLRVRTGYPFNLFTTRRLAWSNDTILVFPAIEDNAPDWPVSRHLEKRKSREGDDIIGHRDYRVGDPLRTVDWKLSARQGSLIVREFERAIPQDLVFSLDQVSDLDFEHGLTRLTAWILRAEKVGRRYGLDLDGRVIPSGIGQSHKMRCLAALARLPGRSMP